MNNLKKGETQTFRDSDIGDCSDARFDPDAEFSVNITHPGTDGWRGDKIRQEYLLIIN